MERAVRDRLADLADLGDGADRADAGEEVEFEITHLRPSRHARQYAEPGAIRFFPAAPHWSRRFLLATLLCVAVLATLTGSALRGRPEPLIPGNPATLLPGALGYGCVRDLAWDPLHPRLALLLACEQKAGAATLVLWNLAGEGQQAIQRIALPSPPGIAEAPAYQHLVWSGDGSQLAALFATETQSGVVALTPTGIALRQLIAPRPAIRRDYPPGDMPLLRWDVPHGTLSMVWLSRAPAYTWAQHDLVARPPMTSPSSGAIGEPASGAAFAIWQPGVLTRSSDASPRVRWTTYPFEAWSPDRAVLISQLYGSLPFDLVTGRGVVNAPSSPALRGLATTSGTHFVAWRADERLLASYAVSDRQVVVRDSQTGRVVAAFQPRALANAQAVGAISDAMLAWSADGSRLAFLDARRGAVDVWLVG